MRDGIGDDIGSGERELRRMGQADVAIAGRSAGGWRAGHSRRVAIRSERCVGPLLRILLFGYGGRRRGLHGRTQWMGRSGRNVVRVANSGRHPGAGESEDWVEAGQSESDVLQVGGNRVWHGRKQLVQLDAGKWRGEFVRFLRRDQGRHGCELHGHA